MPDLSLVSAVDLLEELNHRYDHVIFSGMMNRSVVGPKKEGHTSYHTTTNDPLYCIGMAMDLIRDIQDDHRNLIEEEE